MAAKVSGILKLDAICAKLKNNLAPVDGPDNFLSSHKQRDVYNPCSNGSNGGTHDKECDSYTFGHVGDQKENDPLQNCTEHNNNGSDGESPKKLADVVCQNGSSESRELDTAEDNDDKLCEDYTDKKYELTVDSDDGVVMEGVDDTDLHLLDRSDSSAVDVSFTSRLSSASHSLLIANGDKNDDVYSNGHSIQDSKKPDEIGSSSGSRKSRRKNAKPQSIHQQQQQAVLRQYSGLKPHDEMAQDITQSRNNAHSPDQNDSGILDLSYVPKRHSTTILGDHSSKYKETIHGVTDGVLDLSARSQRSPPRSPSKVSDLSSSHSSLFSSSGLGSSVDSSLRSSAGHLRFPEEVEKPMKLPSVQARAEALKDYAESTMNELLSIYGLNEDGKKGQIDTKTKEMLSSSMAGILSKKNEDGAAGMWTEQPQEALQPAPGPQTSFQHFQTLLAGFNQAESQDDSSSCASPQPSEASLSSLADGSSKNGSKLQAADRKAAAGNGGTTGSHDRFASSSAYINAIFDPSVGPKLLSTSPDGKTLLPDYTKYVKKYSSYEECGGADCKDLQYREHFHCLDCNFKVFLKKEEMIRHFKWHKKRDESLQHGFMRYSPMDDCTAKFPGAKCAHNGKQTHYHCMQKGCNKVYISTSDVQMHANYHRKDSAIIQEGFQRFRATEDCGTAGCAFYGQRTTHFHCRRNNCSFTFKNKADMEKHKTYHQKDELLSKDGFKKFMKYEACNYEGCRYSNISNHIHCIRCDYVLHSTGQLLSHKRKHERRDIERAYLRYKDGDGTASMDVKPNINTSISTSINNPIAQAIMAAHLRQMKTEPASNATPGISIKQEKEYVDLEDLGRFSQTQSGFQSEVSSMMSEDDSYQDLPADLSMSSASSMRPLEIRPDTGHNQMSSPTDNRALPSTLAKLADKLNNSASDIRKLEDDGENSDEERGNSPVTGLSPAGFVPKVTPPVNEKKERDETWKRFLTRYTANDPCHSRCQFLYKDHYHCNDSQCGMLFRSKDGVREHAKHHEQQDRITSLSYMRYDGATVCYNGCPYNRSLVHYHCLWSGCKQVISEKDPVFTRLEHYKYHEYSRNSRGQKPPPGLSIPLPGTEVKRRRGRPPKFPKSEIPVVPKIEMSEEAIARETARQGPNTPIAFGFRVFRQGEPCPDDKCLYFLRVEHFHCVRQRCHHATDRADVLNLHAKDFHSFITILDGFAFFDRTVNCRRPHCHNNKANRHYHCVRPKCDYSFVRYSTMAQHDKKHKLQDLGLMPGSAPAAAAHLLQLTTTAPVPLLLPAPTASVGALSSASSSVVKAAGTYFPVSSAAASHSGVVHQVASPPPLCTQFLTAQGTVMVSPTTPTPIVIQPDLAGGVTSSSSAKGLVSIAPKPSSSSSSLSQQQQQQQQQQQLPLAGLLQQKLGSGAGGQTQPSWNALKMRMFCGASDNCGRPFCKLKKRDHYHCFDCHQAFSDTVRLQTHVVKHGLRLDAPTLLAPAAKPAPPPHAGSEVTKQAKWIQPPAEVQVIDDDEEDSSPDDEEEDMASSSLNLNAKSFSKIINNDKMALERQTPYDDDEDSRDLVMDLSAANDEDDKDNDDDAHEAEETSPPAAKKARKTGASSGTQSMVFKPNVMEVEKEGGRNENNDAEAAKSVRRRRSSRKRSSSVLSDDVPSGYERYSFDVDCSVERCAYRLSQSHYHCSRAGCGYAFCDKSRAAAHNDRHDKTDAFMADQFQQFRGAVECGRTDCEHSRRISHFHCLKCSFVCTDSAKVMVHRKQHLPVLPSSGDYKSYEESESCGHDACGFSEKMLHHHCSRENCDFVTSRMEQMMGHINAHS